MLRPLRSADCGTLSANHSVRSPARWKVRPTAAMRPFTASARSRPPVGEPPSRWPGRQRGHLAGARGRRGARSRGTAKRAADARAPAARRAAAPAQQLPVGPDPVDARPAAVAEQVAPAEAVQRRGGAPSGRAGTVMAPDRSRRSMRTSRRACAARPNTLAPSVRQPSGRPQQAGDRGQDVQAGHVGARRVAAGLARPLDEQRHRRDLVDVGLGDLAPVADARAGRRSPGRR